MSGGRWIGIFLLVGGLWVALLTGCKTAKQVEASAPGKEEAMSPEAFFRSVEEQAFRFRTLTARLNVDLEVGGRVMSSRVDLKMVKDSAFQLSVQPFLGIEIFRMELSRDSIKVLDRMNRRYMAENYEKLRGQTPIEFNFYNLQALFTNRLFLPGEAELTPALYRRFALNQEGASAEIRTEDAMGLLYTFRTDGERKLLSTYVSDAARSYALRWTYADFRAVGERLFPMRMDVRVLKEGASVGGLALSYSRVRLNEPTRMDFSIPSKYERITFAQIVRTITHLNP